MGSEERSGPRTKTDNIVEALRRGIKSPPPHTHTSTPWQKGGLPLYIPEDGTMSQHQPAARLLSGSQAGGGGGGGEQGVQPQHPL